MSNTILTYSSPTQEYMSGLPYGGKAVAAMALNSGTKHRIALNHEKLWRAQYADRQCRDAADKLPLVRELLLRRDFESATALANYYFGGGGGVTKFLKTLDPYQPAGDLIISTGNSEYSSYRRSLDLEKALFTAEYTQNDTDYILKSFTDINPTKPTSCISTLPNVSK